MHTYLCSTLCAYRAIGFEVCELLRVKLVLGVEVLHVDGLKEMRVPDVSESMFDAEERLTSPEFNVGRGSESAAGHPSE